jgi:hypothetical protein
MRITDMIDNYKFAAVVYKNEWDRKTRKYVDRYWKVVYAPQTKTFTPYLMNESQMDAIAPKPVEPWAPEADAAFGTVKEEDIDDAAEFVCNCPPCRLSKTPTFTDITYDPEPELEMPPPMKRDNDEPKGPFKMVRSVNSPPQLDEKEDKPNEADLSAKYWTDYWNLKGPAPLVRSTNEPKLCAWKDLPPPPCLVGWATREGAEEYREKYGYDYAGNIKIA